MYAYDIGALTTRYAVFGRSLLLFSMDAFFAFNIVFLIIGPISTIGLLAWVVLSAKGQSCKPLPYVHGELSSPVIPTAVDSISVNVATRGVAGKLKLATKALAGWERFWVALIVSALAHVLLVTAFVHLNPYVRSNLSLSASVLIIPTQRRSYRSFTPTHTPCSRCSLPPPS